MLRTPKFRLGLAGVPALAIAAAITALRATDSASLRVAIISVSATASGQQLVHYRLSRHAPVTVIQLESVPDGLPVPLCRLGTPPQPTEDGSAYLAYAQAAGTCRIRATPSVAASALYCLRTRIQACLRLRSLDPFRWQLGVAGKPAFSQPITQAQYSPPPNPKS